MALVIGSQDRGNYYRLMFRFEVAVDRVNFYTQDWEEAEVWAKTKVKENGDARVTITDQQRLRSRHPGAVYCWRAVRRPGYVDLDDFGAHPD